jgi:hypothetical protein
MPKDLRGDLAKLTADADKMFGPTLDLGRIGVGLVRVKQEAR